MSHAIDFYRDLTTQKQGTSTGEKGKIKAKAEQLRVPGISNGRPWNHTLVHAAFNWLKDALIQQF